MRASVPSNSTNVRNKIVQADTARVVFAAAAVWATVMAAAAVEGVAGKFGEDAFEAFGAAMAVFAVASYRIDAELREFAGRIAVGTLTLAAAFGVAVLVAATWAHATSLAAFAAPLAAAALAARIDRRAARATRASAKSPGARPAAT